MKPCLEVINLVKSYSGRTVVNGLSFEVAPGEIVGLLGPNGAGKTTAFYMMVGFITPNNGSVYLDEGRRVMGDSTMEVIKMYRDEGLSIDEDFKELLGFVQKTRFEKLGAFIYSREDKISASSL